MTVHLPTPFLITPSEGLSPEVGRLVGMLQYARATTFQAVQGLGTVQLDHRHDARSNSIGVLLAHIAAVERYYQVRAFERRELASGELQRWGAALELGPRAWAEIRGHPPSRYLQDLDEVRAYTLNAFAAVDDAYLDGRERLEGGQPMNRYWQWFHVFEDELSHRGQIRWLRARLPT